MKKGLALALSLALVLFLMTGGVATAQKKDFPRRDITNVVVWGAGGGTDVCNRVISAEMAPILGVNINVINKPGGVSGSLGMSYAFSQPHDGYTLAGVSESCVTAAVQGGWDKRMNVWDFFIVGGSPDVISVTPSSPWKDLKELVDAAKKSPGTIKACASGAGSIHHLNLLALEKGSGADLQFIPYKGSAPCQTAAMTGEVNVVVTSVAEQQQLIRAKQLRPLAMLIPESFTIEGFGTIPSGFKPYPGLAKHLPIYQAIGLAVASDVPADRKAVIEAAFKKAMQSEKIKKWAKDNYYVLSGKTGKAAKDEFNRLESLFSWTLWDLKAATVDPAKLGIPKP
jgi:tripartite-type tricarboxylate transporter receptor subunit TctC